MKKVVKALISSMFLNAFMAIIKILGGIFGKSSTLIADGIHTLTNLATEGFAILGSRASYKKADKKHPLGYSIFENVTVIGIGIVIIVAGITMIENAFSFEYTSPNTWTIAIVILCIFLKYFSYKNMQKKGKELDSNILLITSKEVKLDLFSSIFTLIILIISQFKFDTILIGYVDIIGAVVIASIIIYTGVIIIINETKGLVIKNENNSMINKKIADITKNYNDIYSIYEIYLMKHGDNYQAIIKLICNNKISFKNANKIRNEVKKEIIKQISEIKVITIEMIPKE